MTTYYSLKKVLSDKSRLMIFLHKDTLKIMSPNERFVDKEITLIGTWMRIFGADI